MTKYIKMEFNPHNPIVQLCLKGMSMEDVNKAGDASTLFMQAWDEATNDFEHYIAAYYVARQQKTGLDKLRWYETALQHALRIDDIAVKSGLPAIYTNIAKCYEDINDPDNVKKNYDFAASFKGSVSDPGPFYHGTRAALHAGDLLTAGNDSNYTSKFKMNHIYFTALPNGAGLAAALAKGDGRERVYMVEPTGDFENDPNVTDQKFPGNLTRSYRSKTPLTIVREVTDWTQQTPEQLKQWHKRIANTKEDIIN